MVCEYVCVCVCVRVCARAWKGVGKRLSLSLWQFLGRERYTNN